MSFVRIWVHLVFSTKNRYPFLNSNELRKQVFDHMLENARQKGIWMDCINGYSEHVHCLISLGREQRLSYVAQLIKGESSFWINKNKLTRSKFAWQDDYYAVSVSESHVEQVRVYIKSQEDHHKLKSFEEEIEVFMKKYGFSVVKDSDDYH
jgi:putative transposase